MCLFLFPSKIFSEGLSSSPDVPMPGVWSETWRKHLKGTGFLGVSQTYAIRISGLGGPAVYISKQRVRQSPWMILMNRVWEIAKLAGVV